METRELFWALSSTEITLFYVAGYAAIFLFAWGFVRHVRKYHRAGSLPAGITALGGLRRMLADVLSHRTLVRRDRTAGIAHAAIFYGFVLALAGTTIIFMDYDIYQVLFGYSFWVGDFYLVFSLVLDLAGLALLIGLVVMIWRRWIIRPQKLDYVRTYAGEEAPRSAARTWRWEDRVFVLILLVLVVTGFIQEGLRLYMEMPAWRAWSPVGNLVALSFALLEMPLETAAALRRSGWWFHGILALAFTAAIPWYKAKHMVSVLGSLIYRDPVALSRLPPEPANCESFGIASLADFTTKDMLDFDACTKCGRCHEVCPATASGYPLSPRDLILDLRMACKSADGLDTPVGNVISDDVLWACRSCGACQEICPVGIEHPSKIVRMRRNAVDQGRVEPMLQTAFSAIGNTGNSFGEPARKRAGWTDDLDFAVKDIRKEPADVLWFVGDYASFDPRNQKVSRTVARLLRAANVDFGLLREGERTAGNDVRRAGEEGLYIDLVEYNLAQMASAHPFKRIVTTDPHSYNTLRNEYPEFGDVAEINHYSTVLAELLESGQLRVRKPLRRRVTFHDPCHLGRLNGGYDAPRKVLELIGCEIVEMPRNRDNSFCCGAGGGRIWMADTPGEKPSENRMHEAAALEGIDCFVTCCPKDLNMYEDANKTSGHGGAFTVDDLAELVAEAVELDKLSTEDMPELVERIVERSSQLVANAIMERMLGGGFASAPAGPADAPAVAAPTSVAEVLSAPQQLPDQVEATDATTETDSGSDAPVAPEPGPPAPLVVEKELRKMEWGALAPVSAAELAPYELPEAARHKILVAVKHVGVLEDDFEITDGEQGLSPSSFDYKINEWDESAMEMALLLAEKLGACEVVAVTIGDEDAEASLRKAMAMGADRGVRVWDDSLLDADPITIARGLAGLSKLENPDLFLCGVQSSDLGYGATGIVLAGILGVPHSASVIDCDWDGETKLTLTRELEGGAQHRFRLSVPVVLTVQTGANQPRYATMRMIKQAKKKPIQIVDGASLDDGSAGFVVNRVYRPVTEKAEMLTGGVDDVAAFIVEKVTEAGGD
jgi:Fe-S oxidoreductase/electron transfer flavoprotein alpha/beta subunit